MQVKVNVVSVLQVERDATKGPSLGLGVTVCVAWLSASTALEVSEVLVVNRGSKVVSTVLNAVSLGQSAQAL